MMSFIDWVLVTALVWMFQCIIGLALFIIGVAFIAACLYFAIDSLFGESP